MHRTNRRVAVIGAGPAGLATMKALVEEGHDPVCFERAPSLGGVFRWDERDGVHWESCRLTSSGLVTAFSDFPVDPEDAGHMPASRYVAYLTKYSDTFGVSGRLQFGTTVEAVTPDPDGGWTVRTRDAGGATSDPRFDAVAVCSGLHQHPHAPRFAGQESFRGQILHGSEYRRPEQLRGKRVLIVGAGESGADIAAEAAASAAETTLSLRRGVAVRPRDVHGLPNDYLTARINNSPAHWIFQTRQPADAWKRRIYRAAFLPWLVVEHGLQRLSALFYEVLPLLNLPRALVDPSARAEARTALRVRRLIADLLRESGGRLTEQFGTKSDDFVRAIAEGRCRRAGAIARFDDSRVVFEDGSSVEPDLVILCTGFETRIPFLSEALTRPRRFLHVFNPDRDATLGFIGFVRPAFGAIPPLAELQARWFALVLSGRVALPSPSAMRASIEEQATFHKHFFRALDDRLDHLVDYTTVCDLIAAEIGCKPTRAIVGRESRRFRRRFYASPFVAAQYRLAGPHAKPELARQVIEGLPIAYPAPLLAAYHGHWQLSRLLHALLGREFATKLALKDA